MGMVRSTVSCLAVAAMLMTMAKATSFTVGDADGWSSAPPKTHAPKSAPTPAKSPTSIQLRKVGAPSPTVSKLTPTPQPSSAYKISYVATPPTTTPASPPRNTHTPKSAPTVSAPAKSPTRIPKVGAPSPTVSTVTPTPQPSSAYKISSVASEQAQHAL